MLIAKPEPNWQYLVERPHPWRRQLYIKGRKLQASTVWRDAIANEMSPEEAADNWDLPLAAIQEAFRYCQTHQDLLKMEAEEERYRLEEKEVSLTHPVEQTSPPIAIALNPWNY
ncbi:MAG: hypothetical protein SXA11_06715 [Cyanobacteriota bacterium]|nr:hypothetical protein [Cyanobacteriota bacterium]